MSQINFKVYALPKQFLIILFFLDRVGKVQNSFYVCLFIYCCPYWGDLPSLFALVTTVTGTETDRRFSILELSPEQEVNVNLPKGTPVPMTTDLQGISFSVVSLGQEVNGNLLNISYWGVLKQCGGLLGKGPESRIRL